jgi:hypothetical protein
MKLTFDEVGLGAAQRLAGQSPTPTRFGAMPWVMRALLLIPLLQIIGVVTTVLTLRDWRHHPAHRPSRGRLWVKHILPPLISNLPLVALPFLLRAKGLFGFTKFFMPDVALIALISGGFARAWITLRTRLLMQSLRKNS